MARDHRPAARNAPSATVAFAAAAALAPTEPPPPPEETGRVEGEAPTIEELAADRAALVSKVAALTAENEELEHQLALARADVADLREQFNAAWAKREAEIAALSPERVIHAPHAAPKRRVAAASIACRTALGAALEIKPGAFIPDDADLAGVPAWAIEEV